MRVQCGVVRCVLSDGRLRRGIESVMFHSPPNHRDKRIQRQPQHQQQLRHRDPELDLAEPPDRIQVDDGEEDEADADEDGGVQRERPVLDDDVDGGEFEADEGELGDDVLRGEPGCQRASGS
jgi:hypothetical protein